MMTSKLLLLLPIAIILVSGCTGIDLPFLGTGTTAYENDVVIIRSLDAFPARATGGQTITVVAYIQNVGREDFDTEERKVTVDLYDYCSGLFEDIKVTCPGGDQETSATKCSGIELLRQETKTVEWKLTPKKTELVTPCDLKVSVNYPYSTESITSISFIDQNEYQRQLQEGKFTQKSSSTTLGEGPLKANWMVETPQPVVAKDDGNIAMLLKVQNRGSGFVSGNTFTIKENGLSAAGLEPTEDCSNSITDSGEEEKLIRNERELPCQVKMESDIEGEVTKELTRQIPVKIEYGYEFRAQKRVEVLPPAGRI